MKFGISNPINRIEQLAALGFDYMESQLFALMEMSQETFEETRRLVCGAPIKCPILNMFFRPGPFRPGPTCMKIVGPEVDRKALGDYSKRAADRAAEIGAKYVVIGNGKSRDIPVGWSAERAEQDFMESLTLMGDCLGTRGITLLIEPVRYEETNHVNSVLQGAALVRKLNHSSVGLLADFWHMRMIDEEISDIEMVGDVLRHTHIARKAGRAFPTVRGEDCYEPFFAGLKKLGYWGAMSIEADTKAIEADSIRALALLRSLAAEAGL